MDPKQYAALFFYYSLRGNPEILMDIVTDLSIRDTDDLSIFLHHLSSMYYLVQYYIQRRITHSNSFSAVSCIWQSGS